jgi:hypothetical protein
MKKLRLFLLLYVIFDMFLGGYNGGLFPMQLLVTQARAQAVPTLQNSSGAADTSFVGGKFVANAYNYAGAVVYTGNASTGSASMTVRGGYVVLSDSRNVVPFAVGVPIVISDAAPELVTPTAVSGCYNSRGMNQDGATVTCTITAVFAATHGAGAQVLSATNGLAEAVLDAFNWGGGVVSLASGWQFGLNTSCTGCFATKQAVFAALLPFQSVSIEDDTSGTPQYWNVQQIASTFLAAPATLTATTVGFGLNGGNTTSGTYTGASTYHTACAYVDVGGQVGPESADFSALTAGSGTTNQIGFAAPAASAGAVGYVCYISLGGGTYSLDYEVPVTSSTCTLTKIETVTPACAVTNATYGQTGSNLVVSALTLSTSPVGMILGGVSGTFLTGNPNGRTTYGYVPSSHLATGGIPAVNLAFTAGGIGSATPIAIGTVNIPAGALNFVGKEFTICGEYINTDVNSVAQMIQIYLDAAGSDVAGSPVKIGNMQAGAGPGTGATYKGHFCESFHPTVSGAGATAGSIIPDFSVLNYYLASAPAINMLGGEIGTAAIGSLNLAGGGGFENRISIVHTNTTGNNTPTLQSLTFSVQ